MRRDRLLGVALAAVFAATSLLYAAAQSPPAPGAGHGYLIDKHVAAGLSCNACHSEIPPAQQPDQSVCIKCHGAYKDLAAKTAADQPNPHASHLGEVPCANCHRIHRASENYCSQCHSFDMNTP